MIADWASIYIIYDASITLFEKAWTWHEVPVPNHLMETESEFAPWDLSKAHILVSTPVPLAPFLCHLPLVPCYSVKKSLTYSFSPALLETAKVLVFLLSLVFHVFGVLISLWLHTNAAGLPKGWKTAHIFAHKDPHPATHFPTCRASW